MLNNNLAPILLFVYKRPVHTQKVLESLIQNKEAKYSILYVFADGAKDENDSILKYNIETVKDIVNSFQNNFLAIELIEREKNWGLANNVIDGISNILNIHQKVIVLEDDIIVSEGFLKYMNSSLINYENNHEVATIQGFQFPINFNKKVNSYFDYAVGCWGWATWKNRWDYFEPDGQKLWDIINESKQWKKFDINNTYPFKELLENQIKIKNDSWAIRWYASLFIKNMINLYPTKSLTINIGNDGSGNHKDKNDTSKFPITDEINAEKIEIKLSNKEIRKVFYYRKNLLFKKKIKNLIIRFKVNVLYKNTK
jgi:hypothetical protein